MEGLGLDGQVLHGSWKGRDGGSGKKWVSVQGDKAEWGHDGPSGPLCLAGDQGWWGHGLGKAEFARFRGIWWLPGGGSGAWSGGTGWGQAEALEQEACFLNPKNAGIWILCVSGSLAAQPTIPRWVPSCKASASGGSWPPFAPNLVPWGASVSLLPSLLVPSTDSLPRSTGPLHRGRLMSLGNTQSSHGRQIGISGVPKPAADFFFLIYL